MAPTVTISTPSPPGSVRTPGTPKHGYGDSWEPFSPRKSARISARQQSTTRTPSPRSSTQSTRTYTKPSSQFSTPATSPIKKRMPTMDSVRRASSNLPAQSTTNAGDSLGPNSKKVQPKLQAVSTSTSMLLTPVKTPRKQPSAKTEAASRAIARPLFAAADEETMLSPKKKVKKYTGLTLDSFRAEEVEEDIEIFTDTRDHFPEKDNSAENPFSSSYVAPEPSRRRSKRRAIAVPGEGKQAVEDAVRRSDGVLVVFRGKKIFRKFSDIHDVESDSQAENEEAFESDVNSQTRRNRPMAPSSIKPRLLFRSEAKGKQAATTAPTNIEDEEAVTDIEDNVFIDARNVEVEVDVPETPIQVTESKAETPDAPRFAPASPPSTARVTRSTDKLRGETSLKQARIPSPFDGWRRSKSRAGPQGQKREGDALVKSASSAKRQRT